MIFWRLAASVDSAVRLGLFLIVLILLVLIIGTAARCISDMAQGVNLVAEERLERMEERHDEPHR